MRRAALRRSELCAVDLLCKQGFSSIYDLAHPVLSRFRLPVSVSFESFAGYCAKTGVDPAVFATSNRADGMTVRLGGAYLVLYNEQVKSERRVAFTLAHEIGHIMLSHAGDADVAATEEREANAFAAALLAPAVAIRYLAHREKRQTIDGTWLQANFFLSGEAADHRARDLARLAVTPLADSEVTLLLQLFGRLDGGERNRCI